VVAAAGFEVVTAPARREALLAIPEIARRPKGAVGGFTYSARAKSSSRVGKAFRDAKGAAIPTTHAISDCRLGTPAAPSRMTGLGLTAPG
jgi:hypothetical protein